MNTPLRSTSLHRIRRDHSRVNQAFKSPSRKTPSEDKSIDNESSEEECKRLDKEIEKIDEEIDSLTRQGYEEAELATHMEKLHQYNEIKDICQVILGKLAFMEKKTLKDVHEDYGLDPNES